jgi:hypothetical protein
VTRPVACGLLLMAGVVVAACGTPPVAAPITTSASAETTPDSPPDVRCAAPPADELVTATELQLTIDPEQVSAGFEARLSVEMPSSNSDTAVGASVEWQCWDGAVWAGTHQLVRDWADGAPQTIEVPPGATTTVPAVDLPVPNTYRVIVPEVPPGIYRIMDTAVSDGETIVGVVVVEVIPG